MKFRHYDSLRIFKTTAQYGSFSDAAAQLNLTKGAISYQIKILEQELGFTVFNRIARGIELTSKGQELLVSVQAAFGDVEDKINALRKRDAQTLTIGVSTYFASRWLSPRLMDFMMLHPDIRLRIQPMINFESLNEKGIDLAIRWGKGDWDNTSPEPIFPCAGFPVGNKAAADLVQKEGLEKAFSQFTLLRDRDTSNAWSDWYAEAGLKFHGPTDTLIIPDPNVRVQAVIDGQGVALNDALVENEIKLGVLHRLSPVELNEYGYFVVHPKSNNNVFNPCAEKFLRWL
jgi:LysR family glycine cleavage system transcriptional activator/LysR family transcriptional regulator of beta-lactamase